MEFNAKEQLPGLIDWMRRQMAACGGKTAVVGISGGKDSSVTAALCVRAYGRENVLGVLMPDGVQPDIDYSNGLVDVLNLRHITFNIHGGTAGIRLTDILGENLSLIRRPFCRISSPQAPRASSVTSFPARNRFLARLQPSTPAPNTRIFILKPPISKK